MKMPSPKKLQLPMFVQIFVGGRQTPRPRLPRPMQQAFHPLVASRSSGVPAIGVAEPALDAEQGTRMAAAFCTGRWIFSEIS